MGRQLPTRQLDGKVFQIKTLAAGASCSSGCSLPNYPQEKEEVAFFQGWQTPSLQAKPGQQGVSLSHTSLFPTQLAHSLSLQKPEQHCPSVSHPSPSGAHSGAEVSLHRFRSPSFLQE
jgi:hypothetical protein